MTRGKSAFLLFAILLALAGCNGKKNFPPLSPEELALARSTADSAVYYLTRQDVSSLYLLYHPQLRENLSEEDYARQYTESILPFGSLRKPLYRYYEENTRYFPTTVGLKRVLRFYYRVESAYPESLLMVEVICDKKSCRLSEVYLDSPAMK